MYDDELIRPWFDHLVDEIPGLSLFDAHAHTGSNDPDGLTLSSEALIAVMAEVRARSVVTPMHEPDGYPAANDRVLEESAGSGGRLVPFCRLDPHRGAIEEARRCLEAGARGIKLHPRAEGFELCDPEVEPIFALAHERRLPILIHAGRGIPSLGRDALALAKRFPAARVILAHAAICDLNWLWREARHCPNLFIDTAWWHSTDLAALFSLIPPGQIVYGSDPPYFTPMLVASCAIRTALQAGIDHDRLRVVMGAQLERLIEGRDPLDLGPPPPRPAAAPSILLERVNALLLLGVSRMLLGDSGYEPLALARLACDVGDYDAPEAAVCRNVLTLLDLHERRAGEAEGQGFTAPGIGAVMLAASVSRTPDVPLPATPRLASEADMRRVSLTGHRLMDPDALTARSASIRRASASFPAIVHEPADAAPPKQRDIRRSSAADHLIIDAQVVPPPDLTAADESG